MHMAERGESLSKMTILKHHLGVAGDISNSNIQAGVTASFF